jgi:hypothetical protein
LLLDVSSIDVCSVLGLRLEEHSGTHALTLSERTWQHPERLAWPTENLLENITVDSLLSCDALHCLLLALLLEPGAHELRTYRFLDGTPGTLRQPTSRIGCPGLLLSHSLLFRSQSRSSRQP